MRCTRQFARVELPLDAVVLLASVNEDPQALTPVPGAKSSFLLPLIRSPSSVGGLVSFPVELVYLCKVPSLGGRAQTAIPLPRVDLPIAYAWCEAHVPDNMDVARWGGPLREVEQFSSETATASMSYGRSVAAEGYEPDKGKARPAEVTQEGEPEGKTVEEPGDLPVEEPEEPPTPDQPKPSPVGAAKDHRPSVPETPRAPKKPHLSRVSVLGALFGKSRLARTKEETPDLGEEGASEYSSKIQLDLARNYYRSGKELYEKGKLDEASKALRKVVQMFPDSVEAANAHRLLENTGMVITGGGDESRAAKAARVQVKQELSERNVDLEKEQQEVLEKGEALVRAGRLNEAAIQFKAAESLSQELVSQGEAAAEQRAVMRKAQKHLGEVQRKQETEVAEVRMQVKRLKKRGEYEKALKMANEVRSQTTGLLDREQSLAGEIENLTVLAAKKKAQKLRLHEIEQVFRSMGQATERVVNAPTLTVRAGDTQIVTAAGAAGPPGPAERAEPLRQERGWELRESLAITVTPEALAPVGPIRAERAGPERTDAAAATTERPPPPIQRSLRTRADGETKVDPQLLTQVYDVRGLLRDGDRDADKLKKLVQDVTIGGRDQKVILGATVETNNGQLVVTHTEEGQKQTREFLRSLEVARGPQIQLGKSIAKQRAKGLVQGNQDITIAGTANAGVTLNAGVTFQEANDATEFILKNYDWQIAGRPAVGGQAGDLTVQNYSFLRADINVAGGQVTIQSVSGVQTTSVLGLDLAGSQVVSTLTLGDLASKLQLNLGQKVQVSSTNLDVAAPEANTLGVTFRKGANGVTYAVIDDAQFRTLMQMDARNSGDGRVAERNDRTQDTIVGTDALLANDMTANVRFAGDADNGLDLNGNDIRLAHGSYVLIDNGRFLTAVRPGEMHHWTETSPAFRLAHVPLEIEVPRVGQSVKFEKTLVEPEDELVLSATYVWEGGRR